MITIAELLEARGEIAALETLNQRTITEDELMPLLHNRRVAIRDVEMELKSGYREKFPKWLNGEDTEALCICITICNILDHYSREWVRYNKPRKAIQYLRTSKTYLEKGITEFCRDLDVEEKLSLIREATKRIENGG